MNTQIRRLALVLAVGAVTVLGLTPLASHVAHAGFAMRF